MHLTPPRNNLKIINKSILQKTCYRIDLDEKWVESYTKLSRLEPMLVNVTKVQKNIITMENLTKSHELSFRMFLDTMIANTTETNQNFISNFFTLMKNLLLFAEKYNFFHNDLNDENLMIDTKGNIKLVDPDSFVFIDKWERYRCQWKITQITKEFIDNFFERKYHETYV